MSRRTIRMGLPVVLVVTLSCASARSGAQSGPQRPGNGVTAPQLVRDVKPEYTAAAMKERLEGSIWLELLVKEDGIVGGVRVTRSLDAVHGLDEQAVKAAKRWEFKPGTRDGKPVPVLVDAEMTFTLK